MVSPVMHLNQCSAVLRHRCYRIDPQKYVTAHLQRRQRLATAPASGSAAAAFSTRQQICRLAAGRHHKAVLTRSSQAADTGSAEPAAEVEADAAAADSDAAIQPCNDAAAEEEEEKTEKDDREEDWGDQFNHTFVALSEEELAAQEETFRQDVLTDDGLAEDGPDHVTGAQWHHMQSSFAQYRAVYAAPDAAQSRHRHFPLHCHSVPCHLGIRFAESLLGVNTTHTVCNRVRSPGGATERRQEHAAERAAGAEAVGGHAEGADDAAPHPGHCFRHRPPAHPAGHAWRHSGESLKRSIQWQSKAAACGSPADSARPAYSDENADAPARAGCTRAC